MSERNELKAAVTRTLQSEFETPDHMLILALMNACAYAHAFPEKVPMRDQKVLREGYRKLHETGSL